MIIFNDLRIEDDKINLLIDCFIDMPTGVDGLYIDSIYLVYYKNYNANGTYSHPLEVYKHDGVGSYKCVHCDYVYDPAVGDPDDGIPPGTPFSDLPEEWVCPVCGATKDQFTPIEGGDITSFKGSVNVNRLSVKDFGTDTFDRGLFYVIVNVTGSSAALAALARMECGEDRLENIGIVVDWQRVYELGMVFAAQLAMQCPGACAIPDKFEEYALLWNALRLAIGTCDVAQVNRLWDKFMGFSHGGAGVFVPSGCGCGA